MPRRRRTGTAGIQHHVLNRACRRDKAIRVQSDEHLLTAIRYVERNPLRAGLVRRVQDWYWSSVWERVASNDRGLIADWPVPIPHDWHPPFICSEYCDPPG